MLSEIYIENLAVISAARMELAPGLNVITGETGAGKTILASAISLLAGGRANTALIRPGAAAASVGAVFILPEGFLTSAEADICPEGSLIVRRRISRDGRSRAYACGQAVTLAELERLTGRCLKFSAQHEQRRLMMTAHQLDLVDAYGGPGLLDLRDEYRLVYQRRAELLARLAADELDDEAVARETELLRFQLSEIEAAAPVAGEDAELAAERIKLLSVRELEEAAVALGSVLGTGDGGVMDHLAEAAARMTGARGVDSGLDAISERLQSILYELEELGRSARDYADALDQDPVRLAEVEERLDILDRLKRKYGGSIEAVIAYAAGAAEKLASIGSFREDRSRQEAEHAAAEAEARELAGRLRKARRAAASGLEKDTAGHLKDLAFDRCIFQARLLPWLPPGQPDAGSPAETTDISAAGLSPSGADSMEFFVALNPGLPAIPLKDTASGGELSRIMLAIKSASPAGEAATLVFDEIDAGIGGDTGKAVGAKLRQLAQGAQVICITHMPQIASFADAHFSVVKTIEAGKAVTGIKRLEGEEIVDELCRMMGSAPADGKARAHAAGLLEAAAGNTEAGRKPRPGRPARRRRAEKEECR